MSPSQLCPRFVGVVAAATAVAWPCALAGAEPAPIAGATAPPAGAGATTPAPPPSVGEETIIVVDRPRGGRGEATSDEAAVRDRGRALGAAPFVTVIHVDELEGEATSLAEVLAGAVGTQIRTVGGAGAYASLSVRGAAPGHTTVLVDGIPLSRLGAITTDLGRFQLGGLAEVELYRGAVPVELGGAGVGGALNLVTRVGRGPDGERLVVSAGAGSFAARHLALGLGDDLAGGRARAAAWLGYQGSRGDFAYFSDAGTPLTAADDSWPTRQNNQVDQLDASARVVGTDARVGVLGLRLGWRRQGLPGSMWQAVRDAELSTLGAVVDAGLATRWGAAEARHALYLVGEQQRYDDPADEIGVGVQRRRYRTGALGASTAWTRLVGRHRLLAAAEVRADVMSDRDLRSDRVATSGHRLGASPALALELGTGALVVTPAVRLDVGRTAAPMDLDRPLAMAPAPRWDVLPSPRLSGRQRLTEAITLKGSAGGYARSPTLLELFGDRGFIVGTPELRPERGWSSDLGLAVAPAARHGAFDRLYLEAAGFATRSTDTIVLTSTLGGVARPLNVGGARSHGLELTGAARLARRLLVAANYTAMWTAQVGGDPSFAGRDLPRRPRHAATVRADLADRLADHRVDLWAGLDWQASSFLDQANLQRVPGRALLSVGAKASLTDALALGLEVSNVLDARQAALPLDPAPRPDLATVPTAIADVAGFPLPGRALYLSATWRR